MHVLCLCSPFDLKCDSKSYLLQETKNKTETKKDHDIEFSKYMLKYLLPYLRELDLEQMAEKEIEANIQGIFSSKTLSSCIIFFSLPMLYRLAL